MISGDNFALVRASLATMHAEVLRTIKRKDVGDRSKIDVIYNLMRGYKFDFSLFKNIIKNEYEHIYVRVCLMMQYSNNVGLGILYCACIVNSLKKLYS